ncbi:hypothetical protein cand_036010 [Cryptosporidium andersoni]|uniref:Uncharacterized protein n=1 Tax=Cryptosporidium andersoni TaxID=117008 RepID=A0A1J4MVK8_9CRYT|nr:hypothetical protein cand_036010 [Cryptosporidium andersoni]
MDNNFEDRNINIRNPLNTVTKLNFRTAVSCPNISKQQNKYLISPRPISVIKYPHMYNDGNFKNDNQYQLGEIWVTEKRKRKKYETQNNIKRYADLDIKESTHDLCNDVSHVLKDIFSQLREIGRHCINEQFINFEKITSSKTFEKVYYAIPDKVANILDNFNFTNNDINNYLQHNLESKKYTYKYPKRVLVKGCGNLSNTVNIRSNVIRHYAQTRNLLETFSMPLLIGLNYIIDLVANLSIKFCPKIPDKDKAYPGTGCILLDFFNDFIDNNLFGDENYPIKKDYSQKEQNENQINKELYQNYTKVNDQQKNYSISSTLFTKCYHRADSDVFDPLEYVQKVPPTMPCQEKKGYIKSGKINVYN